MKLVHPPVGFSHGLFQPGREIIADPAGRAMKPYRIEHDVGL